nr:hypothetical protein GCM10020092_104280 [Actinoplanes digitatis]
MSTVTTVITEPAAGARGAARAVYIAFIGSGFTMASWATRIPQVRDELGLNPSRLGLVLLAIAAGSIVSLVLAGQIVARFGSRGTVTAMAGLLLVALSAVGIGYPYGVAPVVVGLFFFGFANGAWDVAMNVQGAVVERHLGKAIMPRFHAGYSVGTVAGALASAAAVALHLPVTAHLVGSAILVGVIVMLAVRNFGADDTQPQAEQDGGGGGGLRRTLATWREPRTLLIGAFVLAFAFAEGAGIDWISIAVIDGYGALSHGRHPGVRHVPHRDDGRPLVRSGAARQVRARHRGPGARGAQPGRVDDLRLRTEHGDGLRGSAALGPRRVARFPRRHERRRG